MPYISEHNISYNSKASQASPYFSSVSDHSGSVVRHVRPSVNKKEV
jgi:hypothetical protein